MTVPYACSMLLTLYALSRLRKRKRRNAERALEQTATEYEYVMPEYFHCRRCKRKADQIRIYEQFDGNPPKPGIRQVDLDDDEDTFYEDWHQS